MDNWLVYLRFLLAIAAFVLGCYGICDMTINGFSGYVLLTVIVSFALAHYIKPSSRKDSKPDAYDWFDALDFIIDIPFRLIVHSIRALGRIAKDGDLDV